MGFSTFKISLIFAFPSIVFGQLKDFNGVDFKKADSTAKQYQGHSLQDIRSLSLKLTTSLSSDVEKFRAIYRWTCLNIENDPVLFLKNQHKRKKLKSTEARDKWNKQLNTIVFETLVKKHKTVCTGYAYLVKELAYHAGLNCEIVDGYGRTAAANIGGTGVINHSWNAVQLNGKWYLCDPTWSSGAVDMEKRIFIKNYNDAYFLAEPKLFIRNHYPLDTTWMLVTEKPSLYKFLNRTLIYSSFYDFNIEQVLPETFNVIIERGKPLFIQFSQPSDGHTINLIINGPKGVVTLTPQLKKEPNGLNMIEHSFSSKGLHTLHVLLNSSYVFTYSVLVK
ncbi:MAG: hypothetical protein KF725_15345 [Cyclobacteriaceae bacterium]|nr:hypothetical protein [Cyclobacteriaceae bacterium]UYN87718.1 MAG: hypothetical protein KIT51_05525 [Cyclobacteriaceae bacterium]